MPDGRPVRAAYTGHETLTYGDYLDLDTGRTLTAEPGATYDVAPSGGRPVPALPPGFTPAGKQESADEKLTRLGVKQIRNGISSIDEVRERLDMPPLKPDDEGGTPADEQDPEEG